MRYHRIYNKVIRAGSTAHINSIHLCWLLMCPHAHTEVLEEEVTIAGTRKQKIHKIKLITSAVKDSSLWGKDMAITL